MIGDHSTHLISEASLSFASIVVSVGKNNNAPQILPEELRGVLLTKGCVVDRRRLELLTYRMQIYRSTR